MAMFGTHLLSGAVFGGLYGCTGILCGFSLPSCVLSAGLLAVASLIPDLDTRSTVYKEVSLVLGICSALFVALYFKGKSAETAFLCGLGAYFVVRYGLCGIVLGFAKHRGMMHSVIAAAIFSLLAYLLLTGTQSVRAYEGLAVFLGYILHLLVDEAAGFGRESFGSAFKFFGNSFILNVILTISLMVLVLLVAFH